jgi:hypothetical protein
MPSKSQSSRFTAPSLLLTLLCVPDDGDELPAMVLTPVFEDIFFLLLR